jgi:hypothetical protein
MTDLEALQSYAAEYGRNWKQALWLDWYNARAIGERGAILHGIRNTYGPEWLESFRFPK